MGKRCASIRYDVVPASPADCISPIAIPGTNPPRTANAIAIQAPRRHAISAVGIIGDGFIGITCAISNRTEPRGTKTIGTIPWGAPAHHNPSVGQARTKKANPSVHSVHGGVQGASNVASVIRTVRGSAELNLTWCTQY